MHIRNYQPGDEQVQVQIYNTAAKELPAFKPATAEEVARRYRNSDPDAATKFYAVEGERIVGYCLFNPNSRISYPWCLPGSEAARAPLLQACLSGLKQRGHKEAWTTYRADWKPVLAFFEQQGFSKAGDIVNYVAELKNLPHAPVPGDVTIVLPTKGDLAQARALDQTAFLESEPGDLEKFYFENAYFQPTSLFALKKRRDGQTLGIGLAIVNASYADPTKLDAAMPCFRLGALGTERERHKRVNGMFSCVFKSADAGTVLLSEAVRRFEQVGLTHGAAQAAVDQPELVAFYDKHFQRQGAFPILHQRL